MIIAMLTAATKKRILFFALLLSFLPLQLQAVENTLQRGIDLLHQGKMKEALIIIEDVADKYPQDGTVQMTLGYVLFRNGDYDRAEEVLNSVLNTTGERGEIHRILAEIAGMQGDYLQAFVEIEQALILSPQNKETLVLKEKLTKEWKIEKKMDKSFGGNFTVTFEGGGDELGYATLAVLEDAYVDLGSRFQLWPEHKTEVILYGNRDFKSLTNAPDWAGGLYDGKIRIPVGGLTEMNENLRRILYHEYAHVLIRTLARHHAPLWLNEGLAQWAAGESFSPLTYRLAKGEKLLPLTHLEKSFASVNPQEASLAYLQSLSLTNFLIEQFGETQILEILHTLGRGVDFEIAGAELFAPGGGVLKDLEKNWQKSLDYCFGD